MILPNPIDPVFRLSTAPVSGETPVHRLAAIDRKLQELELNFAATRRAIDSFCDGGLAPPQSLVDSLSSLSRGMHPPPLLWVPMLEQRTLGALLSEVANRPMIAGHWWRRSWTTSWCSVVVFWAIFRPLLFW